jgi:hypothetical protein
MSYQEMVECYHDALHAAVKAGNIGTVQYLLAWWDISVGCDGVLEHVYKKVDTVSMEAAACSGNADVYELLRC